MIYLIEIQRNKDFTKKLFKSGYLAAKFYQHIEIVKRHDIYIKQGLPRCQAVSNCAIDFNCSDGTIYNAIRRIKISNINEDNL